MHTKKIIPPNTTADTAVGALKPRQLKLQPVSASSHTAAQTATLQTQLQRAERLGHTLGQVSIQPALIQAASLHSPIQTRMSSSAFHLLVQPKIVNEEQRRDRRSEELMRAGMVQMKSEPEQSHPLQAVQLVHQTAQASGQMLPPNVQTKMERSFGTSFSDVRVHEGIQAKAIGALAYAQKNQIHFAPGQYNPQSLSGQALLGHELTHVVQQRAGRVTAQTQTKGLAINADPALEREADELGLRAARGEPAPVPGSGATPTITPRTRPDLT